MNLKIRLENQRHNLLWFSLIVLSLVYYLYLHLYSLRYQIALVLLLSFIFLALIVDGFRLRNARNTSIISHIATDNKSNWRNYLIDILLLTASVLIFHSFFWNKYLPIQEGWFNVYAMLMQRGEIPYRDFYFFLQPLYLYLVNFILSIFGNSIIVLRSYGLFERVIIAILLYLLYRQVADRKISVLASFTSLIYYTAIVSDVIYSYYQTCMLFILLSTYLTTLYIKSPKLRAGKWLLLLSGLFGALAFLTKQTTGLIVPFAIFSFLVCYAASNNRKQLAQCIWYIVGFALPIVMMCGILFHFSILENYASQVFVGAASSKGGLSRILTDAFLGSYYELIFFLPLVFIISYLFFFQFEQLSAAKRNIADRTHPIFLSLFIATAIILAHPLKNHLPFADLPIESLIFVTYDSVIILSLLFTVKMLLSKSSECLAIWTLLFFVATSAIYAHGLSGGYEPHSLLLGLGLFIILLNSIDVGFNKIKTIGIYGLSMLLITGILIMHRVTPYGWWGWNSPPVAAAKTTSTLKPLVGMKMSIMTNQLYMKITQIIVQNSKPTDPIYTFPHIPIFYLLSERYPASWSIVDYFDVCSDVCAEKDAQMIRMNPPKVIVMEIFPEPAWKYHEMLFRQGKPSGQRDIVKSINYLIQRYHYKEAASIPTTYANYVINVWVRP